MKTVKMLGTEIGNEARGDIRDRFADISYFVRKGHNVCGDSAFVHVDDGKVVAAVLDGVSGEQGADQASSVAAVAMLNYLKGIASPKKDDIQGAFVNAHANIVFGLTTVALAVVMKDGRFICGSVGDSVVYSVDAEEAVKPELTGVRIVGPGTPVSRFLMYRNIVPAALGMGGGMEISFREGRLATNELLLLMTDGVFDNLTIEVENEIVKDCSGTGDLAHIIRGAKGAAGAVKRMHDEILRRIDARFNIREQGRLLVAKQDDIAVICVRYTGKAVAKEEIRQTSKVRRMSKK